ncbi:hypothetical protein [Pseudoalteromonas rhizosphaerae]|uniref:hypothetical protein n=1 Tax=Pseudoalteromonas rhizosphaerae TaxID=2518973 RepID=UPI0012304350|nr:hypothetical protein [Pseudoalteromonas rhizosphaerae]
MNKYIFFLLLASFIFSFYIFNKEKGSDLLTVKQVNINKSTNITNANIEKGLIKPEILNENGNFQEVEVKDSYGLGKLTEYSDITFFDETKRISNFISLNMECKALRGYESDEDFLANYHLSNSMDYNDAVALIKSCNKTSINYDEMIYLIFKHHSEYDNEDSLKLFMKYTPRKFTRYKELVFEGIEKGYSISPEILSLLKVTDDAYLQYFLSYYLQRKGDLIYDKDVISSYINKSQVELDASELERIENLVNEENIKLESFGRTNSL